MNQEQLELYKNLSALSDKDKNFSSFIRKLDNVYYKVFSHENPDTANFEDPASLQTTGIMYELDKNQNPVNLVCLPPQKFFDTQSNKEIPSNDNIVAILEKLDGSIIHSYLHQGKLKLKSRTSLDSFHARQAEQHLSKHENKPLKHFLEDMERLDLTVAMEYTSHKNKVIVEYTESKLSILSMRNKQTMESLSRDEVHELVSMYGVENHLVTDVLPSIKNINSFLKEILTMKNKEGFIVVYNNGLNIKHITDDFKTKYTLKNREKVDIPNNGLTELSLFRHYLSVNDLEILKNDLRRNAVVVQYIQQLHTKVEDFRKNCVNIVNDFIQENKLLDKKEFVMKAKEKLPSIYFPLLMIAHIPKKITEIDIKFAIQKSPEFFDVRNNIVGSNKKKTIKASI